MASDSFGTKPASHCPDTLHLSFGQDFVCTSATCAIALMNLSTDAYALVDAQMDVQRAWKKDNIVWCQVFYREARVLPCRETASSCCCKLAYQHPHPRLFPSIQTQFTQIALIKEHTSIYSKRMDVMLIRKDNIKSDYAARGPSLTGLEIILESNVLLFPPQLQASLELFRIICWLDKWSMCDRLFEESEPGKRRR